MSKYLSKMTWYSPDKNNIKVRWRNKLKGMWKGQGVIQRGVKGMSFSTIMQVPSSVNSELRKGLARIEPTLAKATGYNIKIVEKSGVHLGRCFDKVFKPQRCHDESCTVCEHTKEGVSSKCRLTNVVYRAECLNCVKLKAQQIE